MTEREIFMPLIADKLDLAERIYKLSKSCLELCVLCIIAKGGIKNKTFSAEELEAVDEKAVDVLNAMYAMFGADYFNFIFNRHVDSPKWKQWYKDIGGEVNDQP